MGQIANRLRVVLQGRQYFHFNVLQSPHKKHQIVSRGFNYFPFLNFTTNEGVKAESVTKVVTEVLTRKPPG